MKTIRHKGSVYVESAGKYRNRDLYDTIQNLVELIGVLVSDNEDVPDESHTVASLKDAVKELKKAQMHC